MALVDVLVQSVSILAANIDWAIAGVLIGMFFGIIPGMGGGVTLALLIPFSVGLAPHEAFILFGSALGATTFAGSMTAILINTPGTASNAATILDGYPLTRQGRANEAIGASAFSSAAGAAFAILFFLTSIPIVIEIVLLFGFSEMFWVIVLGVAVIGLLLGDRIFGGIITAGLGLFMAFIGVAPLTGEFRFNYGTAILLDGINIMIPIIGLFAIAEMVKLAAEDDGGTIVSGDLQLSGSRVAGIRAAIDNKFLLFRCSIIGLVIGAIPGVGGLTSTFIAYGHAVQTDADPESFGRGNIKGVIAAESANDAKDGGQLFPTLGLGIPGSGSTAVLLGGFIMHGLELGPNLLTEHTVLMVLIAVSLLFSNVMTSVIGLIFAAQLSRVTLIPISRLYPVIITMALVAAFYMRNSYTDMFLAVLFGIFGIVLVLLDISRVPFVIAFIMGSILERKFFQAYRVAGGDVVEAFFSGWLNWLLIILIVATVASAVLMQVRHQFELNRV